MPDKYQLFDREKYQIMLVPCPICNKAVALNFFSRPGNGTLLNISCPRKCFPDGLYTCKKNDKAVVDLVKLWNKRLVPEIIKWKGISGKGPKCPHCDKNTRILPVREGGSLLLRPVCVQNNCHMPATWRMPDKQLYRGESILKSWKAERMQYMLWYSRKLDPGLYKNPGSLVCPQCHAANRPTLKKSDDVIGEVFWACLSCGNILMPAAKDKKYSRNKSKKTDIAAILGVSSSSVGMGSAAPSCSICKRTKQQVEACGSQLEKHHRVPLSDGGLDCVENLMLLCHECHYTWHQAHERARQELLAKISPDSMEKPKRVPKKRKLKLKSLLKRWFYSLFLS